MIDQDNLNAEGPFSELNWIVAGFFQPCFMFNFYQRAIKRRVLIAVIFFVIFGLAASFISTLRMSLPMASVSEDIEQAFIDGEFPEIIIENGIAHVDAPQPYILVEDEDIIVVMDTTGTYRQIDRSRYFQGFLLTRDSLHILSEGEYNIIHLSDLHEIFAKDPIVIDEDTTVRLWQSFTSIFSIIAFLSIGFWNIVIRFMFLSFLGVIIWGISSQIRSNVEFSTILILGIYALVPATYMDFLLGLVGCSFCGLNTILLIIVWGLVTAIIYREPTDTVSVMGNRIN